MPVRVRVSPSAPSQTNSEFALQGGYCIPIIRVPIDAGWSSLVARRAHNPKVVGSNPAPATKGRKAPCLGLFSTYLKCSQWRVFEAVRTLEARIEAGSRRENHN